MKQRIYGKIGALLLALCLSLASPVLAAEPVQDLETAAQTAAEAALTYGEAAQISWAVWQDGEILESGVRFDPESLPTGHLSQLGMVFNNLYGIGSVSKMYTTAAVMQLAEAGKLSLDEPVVKYLPDFKMADERYKDITVRMLLNHSSGLMGSSFSSALLFDDDSSIATDDLLHRLSTQRLKADPGAYSVYCNDGFTLAELLVEAVSGQDFMDYVRAHILRPAGLEHTFAPGDNLDGNSLTLIYHGGDLRALPRDCLGVVGAGGIYATVEDLAAFGGALTGTELLSQASLDAMAAPEYARGIWPEETNDILAFGLGWDNVQWFPFSQSGITALVKGGDTQYYHAGLVVLPEYHLAAAVLTSGGASTYNEMAASQMLIAALKAKDVAVDETPLTLPEAAPASMPAELADLSGYYGSSQYQVKITAGDTLTMEYLGLEVPAQSFAYYDDGSFRDATNTVCLRLVEESNGQIYLYQRAFSPVPGLGGLPASNYVAVKLPENEIAPELQAYWEDLMGNAEVLLMNERYSSQMYLALADAAQETAAQGESIPGYAGSYRIVDENHARSVVQIPGNAGRDGSDITLRRDENGVLWMEQSGGMVYMEASGAPEIYTGGDRVRCTIQPDGYARWYHVGADDAGKTMTVQLPQDAGFWVYDAEWNVTASSVLWRETSAELPENGLVVFAGDPGTRFELTFQ